MLVNNWKLRQQDDLWKLFNINKWDEGNEMEELIKTLTITEICIFQFCTSE